LELEVILFLAGIIFVGAFTQSLTGFGFAIVTIPILSFFLDMTFIIPLGALCGAVINLYLIIKMHQHIKVKEVKNLIIGDTNVKGRAEPIQIWKIIE